MTPPASMPEQWRRVVKDSSIDHLDYSRAIEIAEGVFWVGFFDRESGLHCNPYLIVDGEEAVVIDGGSRPDFPTVMMKILQTGTRIQAIKTLIFHHYDPDLCGSIPNFEDIIDSSSLTIISHKENNMFIRHYQARSRLVSHDAVGSRFEFSSGRTLRFIDTPYAHSAGSFITFDEKTGVLFTSDLFGSYGAQWELFLKLATDCETCRGARPCPTGEAYCPLPDILNFHRRIMTSERALRYAVRRISSVPAAAIAPQHGSIVQGAADIHLISELLLNLEGVGIDGVDDRVGNGGP